MINDLTELTLDVLENVYFEELPHLNLMDKEEKRAFRSQLKETLGRGHVVSEVWEWNQWAIAHYGEQQGEPR